MTRSKKKTPIFANTSVKSEKEDKINNHKHIRRRIKQILTREPCVEILPHENELSDVWLMGKDGKRYWNEAEAIDMRK